MKILSLEQVEQIRQLTHYQDNFDAIVAFGYGPVEAGVMPGSSRLNLYGRMNAIATGMLYQSLSISKIIPTGGKTGGQDKPSEAKLIAQIIQSKFDTPASVFILEEEATDTIFNLVYVANIIDRSPQTYRNLLFVALGFHLPRIQHICSLVRLSGSFIAAEAVLKIRSNRHNCLLRQLLQPENHTYAMMLASQERGIRGIRDIPEYWIPPIGHLKALHRLREILAEQSIQSFLNSHHIDITSMSDEQLQKTIRSIPRQFPN